jgi:vanillate O-demethylase ferredoxin subunit
MGAILADAVMNVVARVVRKTIEATDIVSLELAPAGDEPFPPFTAGAHIDVDLGDGLVRQYSLCNSPLECDRYVIAVKREAQSRGGSVAVHDRVQVGDTVTISPPRNHFPLASSATRHLFLAGGIGITPFMAMIESARASGAAFHLHYFARSEAHAAFSVPLTDPAISASVSRHIGVEPAQLRVFLRRTLWKYVPGTHLYVCGPAPFIDAVMAASAGWPAGTVHREYFANAAVRDAPLGRPCTIRLAKSGREIGVSAEQTVVQALKDAGVSVPTSCEQGVCGTCVVDLVDGEPDHRDAYLTEEERTAGRLFVPCVSRAISSVLTLDL